MRNEHNTTNRVRSLENIQEFSGKHKYMNESPSGSTLIINNPKKITEFKTNTPFKIIAYEVRIIY